jgi:long-chain acyl-CoA synthetase
MSARPAKSTLQTVSARALERDPLQAALEFEGRWYTWGELRHIADQVNSLLDASGVLPDSRIAFIPRNRPSAVATLIGLTARSRHIRMIYAYQSAQAIMGDIRKDLPAAVIAAAEDLSVDLIEPLREAGIAVISLAGDSACAVAGCELAANSAKTGAREPSIEVLTSGTTGPPKQFTFSYELIADHMVSTNSVIDNSIDPLTVTPMFLFFPLGNISGIYSTLPVLLHGIRGVLVDRFTLDGWRDFIVRYRPAWAGVPAAAIQMILDADVQADELSSLTTLSPAAAGIDVKIQRTFEERYGIGLLTSYGATEFGGPVSMMTPELHARWGKAKLGSLGRPYNGAKLRVVDAETGAVLGPNQEGVVEVWAPRIGDRWLRTSDIGLIDEDEFFYHRGRADGAIVRGGFKLLPETIERALLEHDAVAAVGVVGIPDARLGEIPVAAVNLRKQHAGTSIAELERHLRLQLPATYIPARWKFVDELPFTPSMKTDRAAIRRLFADGNVRSL